MRIFGGLNHRCHGFVHSSFGHDWQFANDKQGLGNQLIVPVAAQTIGNGRVLSRERLGGLLKYYHRPAA